MLPYLTLSPLLITRVIQKIIAHTLGNLTVVVQINHRALRAKEKAERRLAIELAHDEGINRTRAEAALQRAVARLAAAQRSSI